MIPTCGSCPAAGNRGGTPARLPPVKDIKMANHTTVSFNKTARIAGFMFLFTFMGPLFYGAYVFPKLTVAGNASATANNIFNNELLFRLGIINEIICSVGAVVFAVVLYILLKPINKDLSLLGLFLKMTEAVLLAVIALGHFLALLLLTGRASLTAFQPEQIQSLVGFFMNLYFYGGAFTMIFHGLNSMVFLSLLYKSKYVPEILSGFGIISYALIFLFGVITILAPHYMTTLISQIIFLAPSILAELTIGLWLLIKGVKIPEL